MTDSRHEYKQWPFLNEEEFDLACAYFDRRYVRAKLGPNRQIFKIRHRRALTTNTTYLEILRLLELPQDDNDLSDVFAKLGTGLISERDAEMEDAEEDDHEALRNIPSGQQDGPPPYNLYSTQPYVTYEVHLHPTYRVPSLWFTLHDLPMGEASFDIEAVYRNLVPADLKDQMRAVGVVGGISAAPHPLTDVPSFFIHPCQTPEAIQDLHCPMKDYIMVWLGLVGRCVGLTVPIEIAQADSS